MAIWDLASRADQSAPWTLVVGGVTALIAALSVWEFRSWYRLKHVPGPFLHSISIYGMNKLASSGRMAFALKELGDKYGESFEGGHLCLAILTAEGY